jgi:uncharacterized membrane protein YeaQ/YmgE (transglycosylase-associated protein family)
MEYLWFVLIGLAAGWLGGRIMKGKGFGLIGNMVVGVIGAILGGFLLGLMGFQSATLLGHLVSATLGACVLIVLLGFVKPRRAD